MTNAAKGWVDSHCHLQLEGGDDHVARAAAAGVAWMVCVGTDVDTSRAALAFADRHATVYAAVGLHPHEAEKWTDQGDAIAQLASEAVAIGETGLDFYRALSPRAEQIRSFRRQIKLALELGKPIIVHCRDAFADIIELIEESGVGPQTVMHCWTGGPRWTRRYLDLGVMFSFAGPVAFDTGDTVRLGAAQVPPERALVETDTPYLAPPPHRGQPNEPAWVAMVGEALGRVWGMSAAEVADEASLT